MFKTIIFVSLLILALIILAWLITVAYYEMTGNAGKWIVSDDRLVIFKSFWQVTDFLFARMLFMKIKCKIVPDYGGAYLVRIKYGLFTYRELNYDDLSRRFTSYMNALRALRKYLHREENIGSTVKVFLYGDILAEVKYYKGNR